MNRKGDVPTMLMIPVTLILVGLALFSFFNFNGDVQNTSGRVAEVVEEVHFSQGYVVQLALSVANATILSGTEDLKKEYQKKIAGRDLHLDGTGNFFGKIRTGDFTFEERDGQIVLEVRGLFVQSKRDANSMRREFEIRQVFEKPVSQKVAT